MYKKDKIKFILKIVAILILVIIILIGYIFIIGKKKSINRFANETVAMFEENRNPIYTINQILLHSSANAVDNSADKNLQDISISQYTDIAIYIANKSKIKDLQPENTINRLYIDNIKVETNQRDSNFLFGYKNSKKFGEYDEIQSVNLDNQNVISENIADDVEKKDKIEFNVIHSNNENNDDFTSPKFFTDCSNPITLGFVNKNIVNHFKLEERNRKLSFDGSILKDSNVDLNKITPKISFEIHIINNANEEYFTKVFLDIPLENSEGSIKSGYIILLNHFTKNEYTFFKK